MKIQLTFVQPQRGGKSNSSLVKVSRFKADGSDRLRISIHGDLAKRIGVDQGARCNVGFDALQNILAIDHDETTGKFKARPSGSRFVVEVPADTIPLEVAMPTVAPVEYAIVKVGDTEVYMKQPQQEDKPQGKKRGRPAKVRP